MGEYSKLYPFTDYACASGFAGFAGWTAASMGVTIDTSRKGWSLIVSLVGDDIDAQLADVFFAALDRPPPAAFYDEAILGG